MDKWIATNGVEPEDLEDNDYIWLCDTRGYVSLTEAYGCFTWAYFPYWMPADIETPNRPVAFKNGNKP